MYHKIFMLVLTLAISALLLLSSGCGKITEPDPSEAPIPQNTLSAPVNEDMKIETPYCDLTIPFAFSELVTVDSEKTEDADSYVFGAAMEDRSVPVYTIRFVRDDGTAQGQLYGTLKTNEGNILVFYEVYEPEDSLTDDEIESFYSAQETINDVFSSLKASTGFSVS